MASGGSEQSQVTVLRKMGSSGPQLQGHELHHPFAELRNRPNVASQNSQTTTQTAHKLVKFCDVQSKEVKHKQPVPEGFLFVPGSDGGWFACVAHFSLELSM